jgi:HEAT repeat protein
VPLLNDREEPVRILAIQALGTMTVPYQEVIPHLLPLLKDPVTAVRSEAVRTLGIRYAVGYPSAPSEAVIPLVLPLLQDSDSRVRGQAAEALGNMEGAAKSAIPRLIPLLNDRDADARSAASEALKKLGYKP